MTILDMKRQHQLTCSLMTHSSSWSVIAPCEWNCYFDEEKTQMADAVFHFKLMCLLSLVNTGKVVLWRVCLLLLLLNIWKCTWHTHTQIPFNNNLIISFMTPLFLLKILLSKMCLEKDSSSSCCTISVWKNFSAQICNLVFNYFELYECHILRYYFPNELNEM